MTPFDISAAIVAWLATAFPTWTVGMHGGMFTERDLPLLLGQAPCLLLSVRSFSQFLPQGPRRWQVELALTITILSRDDPDVGRAELALEAAYSLLTQLPGQRWNLSEAKPPGADSIHADNLYSGYVNNLRIAVWTIAWNQLFILENPVL